MSRRKRVDVSKVNPFRLLFFRRRARLTRQELAAAVGLTEKTIQKLECTRSIDAPIPRSLRDFESVSVDKLELLERELKCARRLVAGHDDFGADLIDYFNQYRHVTEFANPSERYNLFGFIPKAIIFDFDGTLTTPTDKNTWERIWTELGYSSNDCGALAEQFFRKQISHETWCKLTLERFRGRGLTEIQVRRIAKQVRLISGVAETVKTMKSKGTRLYIVSGSIRTIIAEVLARSRRALTALKQMDSRSIRRGSSATFRERGMTLRARATLLRRLPRNSELPRMTCYSSETPSTIYTLSASGRGRCS